MNSLEWLGYAATAVFASSYFLKSASALRKVQLVAAALWVGYGLMIHAMPVVVSNLVVMTIAGGSLVVSRRAEG